MSGLDGLFDYSFKQEVGPDFSTKVTVTATPKFKTEVHIGPDGRPVITQYRAVPYRPTPLDPPTPAKLNTPLQ